MILCDIYYYIIAFAMMFGVLIADLFHLDIDQKPNGSICIRFGTTDSLSKSEKE